MDSVLIYGLILKIEEGDLKGPDLWFGAATLNLIISLLLKNPITVSPISKGFDAPFTANEESFAISISLGTKSTDPLPSKNW